MKGGVSQSLVSQYPLSTVLMVLSIYALLWIWIGMRNANASAWGKPAYDVLLVPAREISQRFAMHLKGRRPWLYVVLAAALGLMFALIDSSGSHWLPNLAGYILCWLPCGGILSFAWLRLGKPNFVPLGLLAIFFLSGAFLGAFFACISEMLLMASWRALFPLCNYQRVARHQPIPMTFECNSVLATMMILTPGLAEESFKAIWLFYRLRRRPEDLPSTCCCICPATRAFDCGCWFKLAPTPYHVILAAMASGGGFEVLENLIYVFVYGSADQKVTTGLARALSSGLHVTWTGLIGIGLACRLFLPQNQRPSLPRVLLPSILLHGLFDYSALGIASVSLDTEHNKLPMQETGPLLLLFFSMLLFTIFTSCILIGRFTGCRCCRPRSCCCLPGFWKEDFGYPTCQGDDWSGTVQRQEPLLQPGPHVAQT